MEECFVLTRQEFIKEEAGAAPYGDADYPWEAYIENARHMHTGDGPS